MRCSPAGLRPSTPGATAADALANALRFGATAVEHEGTLLGVPDPHRLVTIAPAVAQSPLSL